MFRFLQHMLKCNSYRRNKFISEVISDIFLRNHTWKKTNNYPSGAKLPPVRETGLRNRRNYDEIGFSTMLTRC